MRAAPGHPITPLRITLTALGAHAAAPAASTSPASRPSQCGVVTASLRPPASMPAPAAMSAGSFNARIERRCRLIAGVDQNTLLFSYFNPLHDTLEGFEIDMLRRVAQAIYGDPNKIEFKAITTAERIAAIQDGSVDIVADAMTITCDRRKQVDFSTVYYDAGQRVLVPSNSGARGIGDLGGKRVCATRGSTSIHTIEQAVPHPIPYAVSQRTDCVVALQEGRVGAISTDDAILLGFKAQDPYTKLVGPRQLGQASVTVDYCDHCGAPITATPVPPAPVPGPPMPVATTPIHDDEIDTSTAARREPCPVCGAPRSGEDLRRRRAALHGRLGRGHGRRRPRPDDAGARRGHRGAAGRRWTRGVKRCGAGDLERGARPPSGSGSTGAWPPAPRCRSTGARPTAPRPEGPMWTRRSSTGSRRRWRSSRRSRWFSSGQGSGSYFVER